MVPYPKNLLEGSGVEIAPVGLYDAPDPAAFERLVRPSETSHGLAVVSRQ